MSQGSLLPNAADFRPDVKSLGPGSSVLRGSDMIAAEVEQVISHTMEMMLAALSVIWGGIVDRHPRLRIAFLEFGRRLDLTLARPHGPALRRPGLQRDRPEDAAERALPAQLLDLFRTGLEQHRRARRLYRPAQDHVGDRLSASGQLFPRCAADAPRPPRAVVARGRSTRCWPAARWGSTPCSDRRRTACEAVSDRWRRAAGLMAAGELARAGKRVTIVEARDRCGGRIYPLPGYSAKGGCRVCPWRREG